jgi:hypothetical protein
MGSHSLYGADSDQPLEATSNRGSEAEYTAMKGREAGIRVSKFIPNRLPVSVLRSNWHR